MATQPQQPAWRSVAQYLLPRLSVLADRRSLAAACTGRRQCACLALRGPGPPRPTHSTTSAAADASSGAPCAVPWPTLPSRRPGPRTMAGQACVPAPPGSASLPSKPVVASRTPRLTSGSVRAGPRSAAGTAAVRPACSQHGTPRGCTAPAMRVQNGPRHASGRWCAHRNQARMRAWAPNMPSQPDSDPGVQ